MISLPLSIAFSKNNPNKVSDDLKLASGEIYNTCKMTLSLVNPGNNTKTFMRDTLAPLIKPGMAVYEELKRDIFGQGIYPD